LDWVIRLPSTTWYSVREKASQKATAAEPATRAKTPT
jgi:hypothetical protein